MRGPTSSGSISHTVTSYELHTAARGDSRDVAADRRRLSSAFCRTVCGPKIRLGGLPGEVVVCDQDAEFVLTAEPAGDDDPHHLTSTYRGLPDDLEVGQSVLFADGTVAMDVVARAACGGTGHCSRSCFRAGSRSQIRGSTYRALPGLSVRALTAKDLADLEWTATHEVAYVGLSFVRKADISPWPQCRLELPGAAGRRTAKRSRSRRRWRTSTRSSPRPTP